MKKNVLLQHHFNGNENSGKKILLSLLILIFKIGTIYSQISYSVVRTTGITYSSISSGTSFSSWRNGTNTDDNLSAATPIGFNFYYDGAYRTSFSVSTNGFLTFNTATTELGGGTGAYGHSNSALSTAPFTAQTLAPMYDDLQIKNNPGTAAALASSIKYKLSGTAPNRELTVEWADIEAYGYSGPKLNYQIKLNETSNVVEFWYGIMTASTAIYSYTSGLNSLTVSTIPLSTELYTQQTANTSTFSNVASNSLSAIPAENTKIVFTPPPVCSGTPTAGTATAATSSFCTSGSTTLTLTGYTTGVSGVTFQWQNSTDGGTTWSNISGATATSYTTSVLTATTKFLCVVKCTNSGATVNSNIITITINTAPVISCPTNITVNITSGTCGAIVTYSATATGSPAPTITYSINSGTTFNLGTTTVTMTATNSCGTSICTFSVTVNDNINPTITAPANVSVNTTSGCSAAGVTLGIPVTADNCSVASITNNAPSTFPLGVTSIIWTVTDGSGHTATAIQNVTVVDNTNPTIIAPANVSVNTTSGCSATGVTLGTPVTADNCSVASVTNNAPAIFSLGVTSIIWTVTDGSGHTATATQTVTVIDNINPTITAPSPITTTPPAGSCSVSGLSLGTPVTADNCSVASVTNNAPSTFPVGTTIVIWTITDGSGHTATANQTITVTGSAINYWTGAISSNWFDAANWCGGIPTATTNVQISSSALNMPLINSAGAVCKNITINSGATLTLNSGDLSVNGNWYNNGTFTATSGDVNFNGTASQTLSGLTTFYNFDLNNSAGLIISSNINISGTAQLTNGIITTGSNVVTILNGAFLSSTSGYVNGYLKKYVDAGSYSSISYEVGSIAAYTPASIYFNQVLSGGYLTVNTISTDHPSISTSGLDPSKTINRYWNLVGSGLTFDYYNVDMSFSTLDRDAGFIDMYAGVKIYSGASWHLTTSNSGTSNSISVGDVTSLGCIQIGVFNPTPLSISLTPDFGYIGLTSNIVFNGRGFISGATSVNTVAGVTINSTTVNNDSTLTLNVTISSTAARGTRKFAITNIINSAPEGGTSDSLTFTIRKHPVVSFYANRSSIICKTSGNVEFENYSTDGASYHWDFGAGASPATANGYGPYTVTYSTTGLKTVKLVAYSPIGNDSVTRVNYINVTASAPAVATSISGPLNITCSSSTVTGVYSAPLLSDVSYNWTVPAGATITSGLGTRAIVVSFAGTFMNGNISLSETNGCGTSTIKTITVSKAPTTPTSITGNVIVCGLSSTTYSVASTIGATSYTWTLPTGVTSSLGVSPVTTIGTSITVNFAATFVSGNLSVKANNSCMSSALRTIALSKTSPMPGAITGPANICGITTATYSISSVTGATSYTWATPAGVTILSGQGTTSINVSIITSVGSGNITVVSNNSCSTSAAKILTLIGCHSYNPVNSVDSTNIKSVETLLYPNPSSGNFIIQYNSEINSQLVIEMYNLDGKIIVNKAETVTEGLNNFSYNEEELKRGIYFIKIIDKKNNISETKKLIIK